MKCTKQTRKNTCNLIAFFILVCSSSRFILLRFQQGLCNYMSYIAVNSLSQQIVETFDEDDLLPLVVWFNAGFNFITRVIHSVYMLNIPVWIRIILTAILHIVGDIGLALSTYVHISLAFVCIVLIGSSTFLGERYSLLFLFLFPSIPYISIN